MVWWSKFKAIEKGKEDDGRRIFPFDHHHSEMGRTVTDKTRFSPTKSAEARNRNENSSNCERMQQLQRSQMLSKEKQKILMNKLRKAHAAEWKVTDPYADNEECIQFFETEVAIIGQLLKHNQLISMP